MHIFVLVIILAGQPDHAVAACQTYKQCSDAGADFVEGYAKTHHLQPRDISFRIVPATLDIDKSGTQS